MVELLIILDGATDRPGSSLALTGMPALRQLAGRGEERWLHLLDPGVPVGSETAVAALLGWRPAGPVDRARLEAAARGLHPGAGEGVWRIDLRPGGHRLLVIAPPPLPRVEFGGSVRVWPHGAVPPRILDSSTVVIGAPGAATGLGTLMGARVVLPAGATGRPGSNLAAKRAAATAAVESGARRVIVHVGGADEAAHARDRRAKAAVLHDADRELIAPLYALARERRGAIQVGPDHGCDPATGRHVGGPVPHIYWRAGM